MTHVRSDLFVDADAEVTVSENENMAVLYIGDHLTIFAANLGERTRLPDLTALRDLARKMLVACENAMAEGRDEASSLVPPAADSAQLPPHSPGSLPDQDPDVGPPSEVVFDPAGLEKLH